MSVPSIQTAFSAGEIAPSLYGHTDLSKYHVAASTLRNCFVNYRGGAYSRAGTALVIRSKQPYGTPPRLMTFQFSINQGYALEFGDHYMRVHSNGAPVIESAVNIANITQADPAVVTLTASGATSATAINTGVVQSYAPGEQVTAAGGVGPSSMVIGVTNTLLLNVSLNSPGSGVYAPADTIHLAGGTQTTPAVLTVASTQVVSASIAAPGSGGTDGTQTVTGTTGTGTLFEALVTVAGGVITAVQSISVPGSYTVNPTSPATEPVTGASLSGAQLNIQLGVRTFAITTAGVFTANPPGAAFTQASTSGSGVGATFQFALLGPNAVVISNPGVYTTFPSNPVFQAFSSGSGFGVEFNITSGSVGSYNNGDWIVIENVGGMTQVNGNAYIVSGASGSTFQLNDLNGVPVDSTGFGAYTGGGTTARVFTLATPYVAVDLPYLKVTESADVMSLTCVNQITGTEYPPYDLARITPSNWILAPAIVGATIAPPFLVAADATVHPSTASSPPTLPTAYAYVVTAVSASTGEESVASPVANVTNSVDIAATNGSLIINWTPVAGAGTYNVYKAPASYNTAPGDPNNALPVPVGALFGYMLSSYGNQAVDSNIVPDLAQVPPLHADPFAPGQILGLSIQFAGVNNNTVAYSITTSTGSGFVGAPVIIGGAMVAMVVMNPGENYAPGDTITFTSAGPAPVATLIIGPQSGTYPGVVAYFQQRRVYASSLNNPDTFWMSQPGKFLNFDSSIPSTDADAITGTPWSQQVNGVQFMVPMPGGLVVMTGLGAWQVTGAGGSAINPVPITPSSEQAQPQAFNGISATVAPVQILQDILYLQAKGSLWRDLAYNYWVNIYTGSDLTQLSSQLFTDFQMLERAWCEEPYKILWIVRSDGVLLSLTYLKEQEVYGWARHDTLGQFVSVCSVTEPPVDALYAISARPLGGGGTGRAYYVERMNNRIWNSVEEAWAVDCALELPRPTPDATLFASGSSGGVLFAASASVFGFGSIGQVIRMGGGIATVTQFLSSTQVVGNWNLPCVDVLTDDPVDTPIPQPPGTWSITQPVTTISGLTHLVGLTVTGLADGVPIPPTVVSVQGTITLPFPASYVKVGLGFTAQVQTPYLDVQGSVTIQGRRKDIVALTTRIEASAGFMVGTNQPDGAAQSPPSLAPAWSGLVPMTNEGSKYTSPGGATVTSLFTGDERVPVTPDWVTPGQVAVQQSLPLPLQLSAIMPETLEGDLPEQTYSPQEGQKRQPGQMPRGPGAWMLAA